MRMWSGADRSKKYWKNSILESHLDFFLISLTLQLHFYLLCIYLLCQFCLSVKVCIKIDRFVDCTLFWNGQTTHIIWHIPCNHCIELQPFLLMYIYIIYPVYIYIYIYISIYILHFYSGRDISPRTTTGLWWYLLDISFKP